LIGALRETAGGVVGTGRMDYVVQRR
jgi:hypothetical protein